LLGVLFAVGAIRAFSSTWWLSLMAGILEILLGFWASQQMFPARAALLLLWAGFFALFRGTRLAARWGALAREDRRRIAWCLPAIAATAPARR